MNRINWGKLGLAIGITEGSGIVGSIFTTPEIKTWYPTLVKPSFNPPNYLFGPVWTILFVLMGIALYLMWQVKNGKNKDEALKIFWLQLGLNVAWSLFFFGLHNPFLAFIDILGLWLAIFVSIKKFIRVSSTAAYLLLPYLAWVSFAALLNFAIVRLN